MCCTISCKIFGPVYMSQYSFASAAVFQWILNWFQSRLHRFSLFGQTESLTTLAASNINIYNQFENLIVQCNLSVLPEYVIIG